MITIGLPMVVPPGFIMPIGWIHPALSPLVNAGIEPMFCAGMAETNTLGAVGIAIALLPKLGYGTTIGGTAGVRQGSGNPMF